METLEWEAAAPRRRLGRRRAVTGLLAGALVVVTVAGLILVATPGVPASLGGLLHGTPTPTAPSAPGGSVVFSAHGAPCAR